jgi:hypothetical protein
MGVIRYLNLVNQLKKRGVIVTASAEILEGQDK